PPGGPPRGSLDGRLRGQAGCNPMVGQDGLAVGLEAGDSLAELPRPEPQLGPRAIGFGLQLLLAEPEPAAQVVVDYDAGFVIDRTDGKLRVARRAELTHRADTKR